MNWIDKIPYLLQPENRWEWDDKVLAKECNRNFKETQRMLRGKN